MKTKKFISTLLAVLMLTQIVSIFAFAKEETENSQPTEVSITFSTSGCDENMMKNKLKVSSDAAENLGYKTAEYDHNNVKVEGVTVFDAIVTVHEMLYGESFENNPENYLVMQSGYMLKAFGKNAASSGFTVNGIMANDGIMNPNYGSFTAYSCDTARLCDNDDVLFFFYKDLKYYGDIYSWFDKDIYEAKADEEFIVNLNGYCAMYYGANAWQTIIDKYAQPLESVDLYTYIDGEKVCVGKTDKNGNANISFSKEGEYVIFADGETADGTPVIINSATVTVSGNSAAQGSHFFEWLKNIWKTIKTWFIRIVEFLLSFGCSDKK